MKKQEFKKMRRGFRNLQDIFKRSNIRIIGVPEGEEEEQKIENLGNPGSSESPKEVGPKEEYTKAHHNYIT